MTPDETAVDEIDTEDVAEILMEFDNGGLGSIHVDYLRRPPKRSLELVGEQGVLRWDYQRNRVEHYAAATGQWRSPSIWSASFGGGPTAVEAWMNRIPSPGRGAS